MKSTKDGFEIPDRIWYYLYDWNESDEHATLALLYNVATLRELTRSQILNLLTVAVDADKRNNS